MVDGKQIRDFGYQLRQLDELLRAHDLLVERSEQLLLNILPRPIAERLDCTMAQLALAWCTKNPHVSTVITGASKVSQVEQNFGALQVIPLLTDEVKEEMEAAVGR